jgi:hypothetical protein
MMILALEFMYVQKLNGRLLDIEKYNPSGRGCAIIRTCTYPETSGLQIGSWNMDIRSDAPIQFVESAPQRH